MEEGITFTQINCAGINDKGSGRFSAPSPQPSPVREEGGEHHPVMGVATALLYRLYNNAPKMYHLLFTL